MKSRRKQYGFTIVELLIVIVVIAILATISVVAYNGVQTRAKNSATQQTLSQIAKQVEAYNALKGSYPSTGSLNNVYTDSNCPFSVDSTGQKTAQWIPGLTEVSGSSLPQGNFSGTGIGRAGGCYIYASDGVQYMLSAWNAKYGSPAADAMYRRLGVREPSWFAENLYHCNHVNIGGSPTGSYVITSDFYKHSYTISNITSCNETPPAGA